MKKNMLTMAVSFALVLSTTACGSDSKKSDAVVEPDASVNKFTETATWTVNTSTAGNTCYDFDTKAEVACTGVNWDVKLESQKHSKKLWTNSDTSGEGSGGALTSSWTKINQTLDASLMPARHIHPDGTAGVFAENKWYEYNLEGSHQIYPNHKVFLITTDNSSNSIQGSVQTPVYALQLTGYYDGNGESAHPSIRWIDTTMPEQVTSKTYDATKDWVYIDLKTGSTTTAQGNWHIAMNRLKVKLNGGASGSANVAGFLAKQPAGFYGTDKKAIKEKFITDNNAGTLADLKDATSYNKPSEQKSWQSDMSGSSLQVASKGNYPNIDYGWYTYDGGTHQLLAKPEAEATGAVVRSGEGSSFAKMRLAEIDNATGDWKFEFQIQPAF